MYWNRLSDQQNYYGNNKDWIRFSQKLYIFIDISFSCIASVRLRQGSTVSHDSSSCESDIIGSPVLDSPPANSLCGVELTDDVIICGRCKLQFATASQLVQHRRSAECRLRFACRCRDFGLRRQRSNSSASGQCECFKNDSQWSYSRLIRRISSVDLAHCCVDQMMEKCRRSES